MLNNTQKILENYIKEGRNKVSFSTLLKDISPENFENSFANKQIKSLGLRGLQILCDGAALLLAYQSPIIFILTVPVAYLLIYPDAKNLRTNTDLSLIRAITEQTQVPCITAWPQDKRRMIESAVQQIEQQDNIGDTYNWPISDKVDIPALQKSLGFTH